MTSGSELAKTPAEEITVAQSVVLGWLDGPTEGFVQLSSPASTWRFKLHADAFDPDDVDDRLYALSPVPDDTVPRLVEVLRPLGDPPSSQWAPIWGFPNEADRRRADEVVQQLVAQAGPPEVLIESKDLITFTKTWLVVPPDSP